MSAVRPSPGTTPSSLGANGTSDVPIKGSFRGVSDLPLVARQVRFEQLSFWLNPIGAALTIGFSVIFIVIFLSTSGHSTVGFLAHINLKQYYLPAFITYGVMSASFSILALTLVNRREMGLLKRLRLSPLPTWMLLAAIFISSMIVVAIQIVLVLLVGWVGYGVTGPHDIAEFVLVLAVGILSFTAMGVGISTVVPNADAAGPMINLVFFILVALSGLYFPINPGSGLATFANLFPIRHLITASVVTFNAVPGTSIWNDLLVIAVWGVIGAFVALRRWDWSPKRG
jgi:ABC-2 type transport system permease protein